MAKTRRTGFPKRLRQARAEAEKMLGRGYAATLELLPPAPRKMVRDLARRIERTAEELGERGQRVLKLAEKRRKALVEGVEQSARSLERRGNRALARFESQGAELVETLERTAAGALRPLARRLNLATHSELEAIQRRLAHVERKLNGRRAAA